MRTRLPALAVGVWMGNSDNSPNDGKLSLDTSAPLWSAILTEVSKGTDIQKSLGKSLGVVATDINNDVLQDLFVANDTVQNFLFANRGVNGINLVIDGGWLLT